MKVAHWPFKVINFSCIGQWCYANTEVKKQPFDTYYSNSSPCIVFYVFFVLFLKNRSQYHHNIFTVDWGGGVQIKAEFNKEQWKQTYQLIHDVHEVYIKVRSPLYSHKPIWPWWSALFEFCCKAFPLTIHGTWHCSEACKCQVKHLHKLLLLLRNKNIRVNKNFPQIS